MYSNLIGRALIDGYLVYETKEALFRALKLLSEGGWIDSNGIWTSVDEDREDRFVLVEDPDFILQIPFDYHYNLLPLLPKLKEGITDASFLFWAIRDSHQRLIGGSLESEGILDLVSWAENHGHDPAPVEISSGSRIDWEFDVSVAFVYGTETSDFSTLPEMKETHFPPKYYH